MICIAEGQPLGGGGSGRSESAYDRHVFRKPICFNMEGAIVCSVA